MTLKNIGFIGLGKMGFPTVQRILDSGQPIFVYDSKKEKITTMVEKGAFGCNSINELARKLAKPKVILLSVPAGSIIDGILKQLTPCLSEGDTVIDLGNSFYKDSQKRAKKLGKRGIHLIDVGMSGGIDGAKHGACLMIGGNESKVSELEYLFKIISRNGSYKYLGKSGSGHLAKGFHNLIEYGYLQSLAEGLESLYKISKKEGMTIRLKEICDIWNNGSIIESKLILDAKKAFQKYHSLKEIDGSVCGQTLNEMKKLIRIASKSGVKVYSCQAAVKARINSRKNPTYSGKIINAIRNVFGGHKEWKK